MSTEHLFVASSGHPDLPVVVVVHGAMDRSAGLLRLSRRLTDRYRVVRYDRRGYGRSIGVGGPYTVATHVDDLERVVSDVDQPVRVFGHSLGGNIALAMAVRRPQLVHSVAAFETPLSWLDSWPGNTAGAAAALHRDPADSAEAFMRRLVGDEVWERLPPSTRQARRDEGAAMVAELADLQRGAPWDPAAVRCPVLAIRGEHARPHHRTGTATLASWLPDLTVAELPGAGHGAPNSHPDALAALLMGWWGRGAS